MAIKAKKVQPAKTAAIEEAKKVLSEYNDFIFADFRGLTVEQITTLRGKLREHNAVLKVIKNNFARIAFEEMEIDNVAEYLKGPTVIAMTKEDSKIFVANIVITAAIAETIADTVVSMMNFFFSHSFLICSILLLCSSQFEYSPFMLLITFFLLLPNWQITFFPR